MDDDGSGGRSGDQTDRRARLLIPGIATLTAVIVAMETLSLRIGTMRVGAMAVRVDVMMVVRVDVMIVDHAIRGDRTRRALGHAMVVIIIGGRDFRAHCRRTRQTGRLSLRSGGREPSWNRIGGSGVLL